MKKAILVFSIILTAPFILTACGEDEETSSNTMESVEVVEENFGQKGDAEAVKPKEAAPVPVDTVKSDADKEEPEEEPMEESEPEVVSENEAVPAKEPKVSPAPATSAPAPKQKSAPAPVTVPEPVAEPSIESSTEPTLEPAVEPTVEPSSEAPSEPAPAADTNAPVFEDSGVDDGCVGEDGLFY